MASDYNKNSTDSMFSRILTHMEESDERALRWNTELLRGLNEVRMQVEKTNGRVTALEQWRSITEAVTATKAATIATAISIAVGVGAWLLKIVFHIG